MAARHRLYFDAFVVSGLLLAGAALMGLLEGLSALSGECRRPNRDSWWRCSPPPSGS